MSHVAVNHPLRPLYRGLAAIAGGYLVVFGVVGFLATAGDPMFDRGDVAALGLRTNPAFAIASIFAGAIILLALLVGRNVDAGVNQWVGVAFLVAGTAMLALLNTDLNVLNASVATVIASDLIGMLLLAAGLYGRVRPRGADGLVGQGN